LKYETKKCLQLDGFVPVDDVSRQGEALHVDDVDVAFFRSDVEPFGLERQVEADDPKLEKKRRREKREIINLAFSKNQYANRIWMKT